MTAWEQVEGGPLRYISHLQRNPPKRLVVVLVRPCPRCAVSEITNRKNHFASEKKKLAESTQAVETETNQCKLREIELVAGAPSPLFPSHLVLVPFLLTVYPLTARSAGQGGSGEEGERG